MDTADDDKRFDPRSNIFVIATLYGAGGSVPVRVRNMSRTVRWSRRPRCRRSARRCVCAAAASAWMAK